MKYKCNTVMLEKQKYNKLVKLQDRVELLEKAVGLTGMILLIVIFVSFFVENDITLYLPYVCSLFVVVVVMLWLGVVASIRRFSATIMADICKEHLEREGDKE